MKYTFQDISFIWWFVGIVWRCCLHALSFALLFLLAAFPIKSQMNEKYQWWVNVERLKINRSTHSEEAVSTIQHQSKMSRDLYEHYYLNVTNFIWCFSLWFDVYTLL